VDVSRGINVALRKDNGHRLVASGYVIKYAHGQAGIVTGDGTGFLHMDGDLVALVEQGKNGNMLTCGGSLDDEDGDNCTIVVHGSHRHSAAMLATLREHGAANATAVTTTDFNKTWRKLLQPHYGSPTRVPCKQWGMRSSQLGVVDGSTDKSTIERKVTYPWYICYGPDYENSDIANNHTHAEQQANHSLCLPPTKEPSGKKPKATVLPILSWSISMTPRHALGQAIMAGIRYEHRQVIHEMDQLFSPDKAIFDHYVKTTRANSLQ
jgi:hypothetical protein